MRRCRCAIAAVLFGPTVACEQVIVDDYRRSRVIIEGEVLDVASAAIFGATVQLTAVQPLFLSGDTVATDAAGTFRTELHSFGVGSFRADICLVAEQAGIGMADTVLTDVWIQEDRGGRLPDTVHVQLRLAPSGSD